MDGTPRTETAAKLARPAATLDSVLLEKDADTGFSEIAAVVRAVAVTVI